MKIYFIGTCLCILAASWCLSKGRHQARQDTSILLENVEALASNNENRPTDFWCCGTTGVCLDAPNLVIVGKLSLSPC